MRVSIDSITTICFELEVEHEDRKATALLQRDAGDWVLTRTPQKGTTWLASSRIDWPEAIKRALISLRSDVGGDELQKMTLIQR